MSRSLLPTPTPHGPPERSSGRDTPRRHPRRTPRRSDAQVLVINETPRRISIESVGRSFLLAPLETRLVPEEASPERLFPATYAQLHDRRQLTVQPAPARRVSGVSAQTAYQRMRQVTLLCIAGVIGLLLPAIAMFYGTEVHRIVSIGGGHWVSVVNSADTSTVLTGRALQLVIIAVGALLPALMYFQFDRDKLGALRARWLRQVFRLDGQVQTVSDVRAKYGLQLDEIFGRSPGATGVVGSGGPPSTGRLSPILVCTLVTAVGWSLILMNSSVVGSDVALLGVPSGEQIRSVSFLHLFTPEPSTLMFGFLGAYFFGVQLVLRGYVRGDLRPKAYNGITVRVIITLILAWLLQAVAGEHPTTWALAFLTGIVPETAVQWIRDTLPDRPQSLTGRRNRPSETDEVLDLVRGSAPLTDLEGVDLYDRARLADEGITNVQALAHHSLVDLMLNTRIPAARLVDWLDQAILYLHLAGSSPEGKARLGRLRLQGIRTATQLISAHAALPAAGRVAAARAMLALPGSRTPDLDRLVAAMANDEWLAAVTRWRTGRTERPPLEITVVADLPGTATVGTSAGSSAGTSAGSSAGASEPATEGSPLPSARTAHRSPAR